MLKKKKIIKSRTVNYYNTSLCGQNICNEQILPTNVIFVFNSLCRKVQHVLLFVFSIPWQKVCTPRAEQYYCRSDYCCKLWGLKKTYNIYIIGRKHSFDVFFLKVSKQPKIPFLVLKLLFVCRCKMVLEGFRNTSIG